MGENRNRNGRRSKGNNKKLPPNGKFEWKKATKTLTFWILIILGSIVISQLYTGQGQREVEVAYTEFVLLVSEGKVERGTVIDRKFHGELRIDAVNALPEGKRSFVTVLPPNMDASILKLWDENGVAYEFKEKATNWFGYLLTSILPWVLLIGIWILVMRRMQGGGPKGIFSFGKSRAKLLTENHPKQTFDDVAGAEEAKEELREIIDFLKDPKKFQRLGGRIPRGALLLGHPGTGKTLLAKAVAGEAGVPFYSISGADFVEMFVGVGASRVRDLFEQGKKNAPCIIFIDEIDAVGRHRGAGLGGGHDEREQTLNQLLVEMDGFDSNEGVILLAATNRPDVLDPALLRPGRFDRQIVVDRPDVKGREAIIKVHTRKIPLSEDVNFEVLAKGTPGLSGADLENIVNEAALIAAKRSADKVKMGDFEAAKDKVMMGAERKSLIISDREKRNTAYHEAGHVMVSKLIPGSDPVHKVTIIPRGRALGLTHFLPIDEKHNYSRSYLETSLSHLLGGRAAEKIVLSEYTTGAGNDIERATEIARKMVCEWGMSDKIGPLSLGKKEEEIFLGKEFARHRDYSERTAEDIDSEIRRIVEDAEKRAESLIGANLDKLHDLAAALLEREILDGHEVDLIMEGKKLRPKSTPRRRPGGRRRRKTRKPATPVSEAAERKSTPQPKTERKLDSRPAMKSHPKLADSEPSKGKTSPPARTASSERKRKTRSRGARVKPKTDAGRNQASPSAKSSAPTLLKDEDFKVLTSLDRLEREPSEVKPVKEAKSPPESETKSEKPPEPPRKQAQDSEPKTPSRLRRASASQGGMIKTDEDRESGENLFSQVETGSASGGHKPKQSTEASKGQESDK